MKINKLKCAIGWHVYLPSDVEVDHIQGVIFRMTYKCKNCGKKECCLIKIPLHESGRMVKQNEAD